MKRKIVGSKIYGQDAGLILETFQNIVDEIPLPEGYNWDYKIDRQDDGDTAGQFFVMTDDNQPVVFITFALAKDGKPIDILNDPKVFDTLVNKVSGYVESLGDLSEYVGNPESEVIELSQQIKCAQTKVFEPVLGSLKDVGLSIQDDEFLFQFIYDWLKTWEEYPTYDEVIDEYDSQVTRVDYKDAVDRLNAGLIYVNYYRFANTDYLELLDAKIWLKIYISDDVLRALGDEAVWEIFQDRVDWATDRFEAKSGTNVYLLGRDGQHVCIKDTVDNVLRFPELQKLAKELEKSVVEQMENLLSSNSLDDSEDHDEAADNFM